MEGRIQKVEPLENLQEDLQRKASHNIEEEKFIKEFLNVAKLYSQVISLWEKIQKENSDNTIASLLLNSII